MGKMDHLKIYEVLKNKIIWLEVKPEGILHLNDLAESFGVSRGPVKEALLVLQAEGWLLRNGTQFMVMPLTLDRLKEMAEMRSFIEIQAYVWAMERMKKGELEQLNKIKDEIQGMDNKTNYMKWINIEMQFHKTMNSASHNTQLAQMLNQLIDHFLRFWLAKHPEIKHDTMVTSNDSVLKIIKAVNEKDESTLREAVSYHLNSSFRELSEII
jgi:DNA-binding GntR family transcriptional regulator